METIDKSMETIDKPHSQPELIDSQQAMRPPLHPSGLWDLFFSPSRFFAERTLDWSPYHLVAIWIVGMSATIDRIDRNLIRADLGSPRQGLEIFAEIWGGYWFIVLLGGLMSGAFIWLVGGWWYRVRLGWSGAMRADKREARLVYIYASLVSALPSILVMVFATLLFKDYAAYRSSEEYWSSLLILFLFWSVVVSYKGVMTRFDVHRGKAQLWFLWLPIMVYLVAAGAVLVSLA